MKCPMCGMPAEQDEIDIGVGNQPISGWYCPDCQWSEDLEKSELEYNDYHEQE